MRTYWTAHGLARLGHEVEVITNALEAEPPFRLFMRDEDWQRCEGDYGAGRVRVHWTDPVDRAQFHLPMASPFVSKLAGIAARLHAERPFDVIFSHYLEPYGVAGYLAAQMTGAPHVVRMAGSDSGRLWHHPQLEPLYDHVLRSAAAVIAAGVVAERAMARGVDPARIAAADSVAVPEDLFAPLGPVLDLAALRAEVATDPAWADLLWGGFAGDRPYLGIYGKLGARKGSFALLEALAQLKRAGLDVGLVALAHGRVEIEHQFRSEVERLDLEDRVLQVPFLPHWRVPEFLRGCLAVCCLEQDFPIAHHIPIVALEVLLCGKCLIGSTEVIRKLPDYTRLPDGYGCVAIEDVSDVDQLSARLAAIVRDPVPAAAMGARGHAFARALQQEGDFPHSLERILATVAARESLDEGPVAAEAVRDNELPRFPFARRALAALGVTDDGPIELMGARDVLGELEQRVGGGQSSLAPLAAALRVEIAVAAVESEPAPDDTDDPLFRLCLGRWALAEEDLPRLVPVRDPALRLLVFAEDIALLSNAGDAAELPAQLMPGPSFLAAFAGGIREPLLVDRATARILELSDGTRTVATLAAQLRAEEGFGDREDDLAWIEALFLEGLVRLCQPEAESR